MKDPTTERAHQRSRLGLTRETNILRTKHSPKPTSGSRGVSLEIRNDVLQYANQFTVAAASRKFNVNASSIYRWIIRMDPLQMSGNKSRGPNRGQIWGTFDPLCDMPCTKLDKKPLRPTRLDFTTFYFTTECTIRAYRASNIHIDSSHFRIYNHPTIPTQSYSVSLFSFCFPW